MTAVVQGNPVTYTITASNATGPSGVTGATVTDNFPAQLSAITWTCAGSGGATCVASGTGNLSESVDLPVGGSVIFTVTATANGTGQTIVNTATVAVPGGMTDPNAGNNSATDNDTVIG